MTQREQCVACSRTVYIAERVLANRFVFHRECLRCAVCNKRLGCDWFLDGSVPMCKPHYIQKRMSEPMTSSTTADSFKDRTRSKPPPPPPPPPPSFPLLDDTSQTALGGEESNYRHTQPATPPCVHSSQCAKPSRYTTPASTPMPHDSRESQPTVMQEPVEGVTTCCSKVEYRREPQHITTLSAAARDALLQLQQMPLPSAAQGRPADASNASTGTPSCEPAPWDLLPLCEDKLQVLSSSSAPPSKSHTYTDTPATTQREAAKAALRELWEMSCVTATPETMKPKP